MPKPIRRVVTGHNAAGRSVFIMDGAGAARLPARSRQRRRDRTVGDADDARRQWRQCRGDRPCRFGCAPPKNGTVFRIIEYPPDRQRLAALAAGARQRRRRLRSRRRVRSGSPRHPGFHKTNSVDYAIVLSGEIYALMDEGEVLLKAGDVLVQRGTNHAWSNRTDEPAYVAFVLIDAEPV